MTRFTMSKLRILTLIVSLRHSRSRCCRLKPEIMTFILHSPAGSRSALVSSPLKQNEWTILRVSYIPHGFSFQLFVNPSHQSAVLASLFVSCFLICMMMKFQHLTFFFFLVCPPYVKINSWWICGFFLSCWYEK